MSRIILLILFLVLYSCKSDDDTFEEQGIDTEVVMNSKPNILLIIADDIGLDASPGYAIGSIKPNMPNLQQMISSGIRFTNVWSYPTCTPTRASILTGKYGFKTNVMKVGDVLSTSETSIQKYIHDNTNATYANAVIGKWHLSNDANHPLNMGVDYYAGLLSGGVQSYTNWNFLENGITTTSNEYTTTKFTDLAINWVANQTKPWFLWLAYNAPHTPFHVPPSDLHFQGSLSDDQASIDANPTPYYMAALEAMDSEIGRLLNSISQEEKDNTIIIFIGDNGTPNKVAQEYRSRRVKGTVYQGGVNIPMVISGATVSRTNEIENALINTTDLFATIAAITGVTITEIHNSISFKDLFSNSTINSREFIYTEIGKDSGGTDYTIRNTTHKYILFSDGTEALYDLNNDPLEGTNLLNPSQLPLSDANSIEKEKLIDAVGIIRD